MRKSRIAVFMLVSLLIAIGIVMIYSASAIYAYERYQDSAYFLKRHLFYILIGIAGAVGVMLFDYRRLRAVARPLLFFSILLLALVLVPAIGKEAGGARRWLSLIVVSPFPARGGLAVFFVIAVMEGGNQ